MRTLDQQISARHTKTVPLNVNFTVGLKSRRRLQKYQENKQAQLETERKASELCPPVEAGDIWCESSLKNHTYYEDRQH